MLGYLGCQTEHYAYHNSQLHGVCLTSPYQVTRKNQTYLELENLLLTQLFERYALDKLFLRKLSLSMFIILSVAHWFLSINKGTSYERLISLARKEPYL